MATETELINANIEEYLYRHQHKELLRFVSVGSVDDGKSTLIGRLLHDTNSIYQDQIDAAKKSTKEGMGGEVDYSLFTDGLKAEREQGITIDVAYRYFTTPNRKFIIADTPGHVQYTRNMATGASTAHVAIILIDARLGVLPQSRRHAYIASLLGIPYLAVCINKMDLMNYDQNVFESIQKEFKAFAKNLGFQNLAFFPISALKGDNVVESSANTPWYTGNSLLHYLETIPIPTHINHSQFCFPVQIVLRPHLHFRGYSGTIASGLIKKNDKITVLPSGKTSKIKSIVTNDCEKEEAFAPQAVTLTLEDEIDISRGDALVHDTRVFPVCRKLEAMLVWMSEAVLEPGRQYWIKHTSNLVTGAITKIHHIINVDTLEPNEANTLRLNDIGKVSLSLSRPITVDLYKNNRQLGAFILIDRLTNATVAAGMIDKFVKDDMKDTRVLQTQLTPSQRAERFSQKPCVIWITGLPGSGKLILARTLEKRLFESGYLPYSFDRDRLNHKDGNLKERELEKVLDQVGLVLNMGMLAIVALTVPKKSNRLKLVKKTGAKNSLSIFMDTPVNLCQKRLKELGKPQKSALISFEPPKKPDLVIDGSQFKANQAVDQVLSLLQRKKILR